MYLLNEKSLTDPVADISRAWSTDETFVLVPAKLGTAGPWLEKALELVPERFSMNHFGLLTSGSTGTPKLIIGRRDRAENLALTLHDRQDGEPVRETILALPLTYSYAFVNQWVWSRVMNRRVVATQGLSEPETLRQAFLRADQAMLCLVGIQVPLLLQYFAGEQFSDIIRLHFAGGRFPQQQLDELRGIFPQAQVFNNYGCAEAMPRLTVRRAEDSSESANVGFPLPGVELLSSPEGDLKFRSRYGAVGFVDAHGFEEIHAETWVATGDCGERVDDGSWRLTGRKSEVFKRHGEKVSLSALQSALQAIWRGSMAFYRQVDPTGEEGHILVVSPTPTEIEVRQMLRKLRSDFPRACWPLQIESLAELPLLYNGKIDVPALISTGGKSIHWRQHLG